MAIVVLSIAAVALLLGFGTSISSSVEHRNLASLDSATRLAANLAIADVQQQANNAFGCQAVNFDFSNLPAYTVTATPSLYWNQSGTSTSCPTSPFPTAIQYSVSISSTGFSTTVTTVVYSPGAPTAGGGGSGPLKLVWLQQPTSGIAGAPVSPQPEIAIVNVATGNIVTSDLSSVTLNVLSGPSSGFSTTCASVESYGIFQFSGCSLSAVGTYSIEGVDSNSGVSATPPDSLTISQAPPAQLVFTTSAVTGTASIKATLGVITIQEQDSQNNPTTLPLTVNLSSSSSNGFFATTSGGPGVTSVSIPAGQSTVSFYYGDTTAGNPLITASSGGLAPGTQVETIKPGTPNKLVFNSSPFTAPSSTSAQTAFILGLVDAFGNPTSQTNQITVNLSSSSSTGIFAARSGGGATKTVTIPGGQTSVTAYYGDPTAGTPTLTGSGAGLTPATQTETITIAPTKLVFTTSPVTGAHTSGPSATIGAITIQEQAANGTPTTVAETVTLRSSSFRTYIFSTSEGATSPTGTTTVTIPAGQSSVTVYYGDSRAGTPTITASANGLTSATQTETVT